MEQAKSIALIITAIVAIIAVVGLILMFTGGKTGAGIYTNFQGNPFPYTRWIERSPTMENPAAYGLIAGQPAPAPLMGGASEKFITDTEEAVSNAISYGRDPYTHIPSAMTTCQLLHFPGNVRAPFGYGYQLFINKQGMGYKCFTEDMYGNKVRDLLPMFYGCCNR